MKLVVIAIMHVLLAGCRDDGAAASPGKDWSSTPLDVTIESKVHHVAFRIRAPVGMKLEDADDAGATIKQWRAEGKDFSFMVAYAAMPTTSLDAFVRRSLLSRSAVIDKAEATADGYVLVSHMPFYGLVAASVQKAKGETHLACRASQAKTGGVPNPAATMAWLEKLCASLTIL